MNILEQLKNVDDHWLRDWPIELAMARFSQDHHGDFAKWNTALNNLPNFEASRTHYGDTVEVLGKITTAQVQTNESSHLKPTEEQLRTLHPWRKGPFRIANIHINTEWRSDWKWARIQPHLNINDHRILDIGSGNGYFGWRMLQAGAQEVIGIDPTLLFCMQHQAIQHFTQDLRNWVLPLGIEDIPISQQFDSVFSMGVIYHRREPQAHVEQLYQLTKPGGQCILESLIVESDENLYPPGRYARMRNVWCVPTTQQMTLWMKNAGFNKVRILDVTTTTQEEQRTTDWMTFESLNACLSDQSLTIEGHPAPRRAVICGAKA